MTYRNDEPGQQRLGPYLAELDRAGRVERLELARLDQVETGAQLVGILGAAPAAELVDAVFARSEGNPFFSEELLAAVRAGSQELPVTLRDLLRGRVQALPQPTQQVLGMAVAGRPVPHRLLAKVAGLDDPHLDAALGAGVAHQLLIIRPHRDAAGEPAQALAARVQAGLAADQATPLPRQGASTSEPWSCGSGFLSPAKRRDWTWSTC
jgi:hypothetical protein